MSEQFFDNNDNKNNEYHFTGDQLNQTVINDTPPTAGPDGGTPNHESRKPKTKKPMTMGKKWAVVVSMALVFGLIAGGTMFGVNTVGNLITGAEKIECTACADEYDQQFRYVFIIRQWFRYSN